MKRSKDTNYFSLLCQQCDMVEQMIISTKEIGTQSLYKQPSNKFNIEDKWKRAQENHLELWKMLRNEFLPPMNREDIYELSSKIQQLLQKIYYYIGLRVRSKVNTSHQEDKLLQELLLQNKIHRILIKEMEGVSKSKVIDSEIENRRKELLKGNQVLLDVLMNQERHLDGIDGHLYKVRLQLMKDIFTENEGVGNTIEYIILRNS